jgi:hypothetical protein
MLDTALIAFAIAGIALMVHALRTMLREKAPWLEFSAGAALFIIAAIGALLAHRPADPLEKVSVHLGPLFWLTPDQRKIGVHDIRLSDVASFEVDVSLENRSSSSMDASVWVDKMYMTGPHPENGVSSLKDETNLWLALGNFRYLELPPNHERTITIGSDTLSGSRLSELLSGRMAFVFDGVWAVKNGKNKPRFFPFCGYFSGGNALHGCRE